MQVVAQKAVVLEGQDEPKVNVLGQLEELVDAELDELPGDLLEEDSLVHIDNILVEH